MRRAPSLLYELMPTLNPAEVERILIRLRNAPLLQMIWDAFSGKKIENDDDLRASLDSKIGTRHFVDLKSRFINLIMDCLVPAHFDLQGMPEEEKLYYQVETLLRKSMIRPALPMIEEATQVAKKNENSAMLYTLLKMRVRILENHPFYFEGTNIAAILQMDLDELLRIEAVERYLLGISIRVQDALHQPYDTRMCLLAALQENVENMSGTYNSFPHTELDRLRLQYMIARYQSRWQDCIRYAKTFVKACEPQIGQANVFRDYYHALYQLALLHILIGDTNAAHEHTRQMYEVSHKLFNENPLFEGMLLVVEIHLTSLVGDELKGDALCSATKRLLKRTPESVPELRARLQFTVGWFQHLLGKPSEAIQWVLDLRNQKLVGKHADMLWVARVIFLCAHYEQDNLEVVMREAKSILSELKKVPYGTEVERTWLGLLQNLTRADAAGRKRVLEKAIHTLDELSGIPEYKIRMEHFPYTPWLRSQLHNTRFYTEVHRE